MRLRFGETTFDGDRRVLLRGPEEIHLSPKGFRLLELLLARRPAAISRSAIQEVLWPETFVSDGGIATLVNEIRKAIGDSAREPAWIRTVHGFGYAFAGDALEIQNEPAPPSRHSIVWAGEVIVLAEGENVLGRDPSASVFVGHPSVSRHHARILVTGERAEVEDLASKNGTWKGTERVSGRVTLFHGDTLVLGSANLVYSGPSTGPSARTRTVA